MNFGAIIIGDEILSGKRVDRHFSKMTELLGARGLRLSWAEYLGDERERIAATLKRTFTSGDAVFCFGGIGNTPDDHTRQAAALALGVELELHPDAEREIRARFGEQTNDTRLSLGTFPRGVDIVPNPFNRIAGFCVRDHYFLPGFPQMAHPMVEWVLDTLYPELVVREPDTEEGFIALKAREGDLIDLMQATVARYPALRFSSLPSFGSDALPMMHIEFGLSGAPALVRIAIAELRRAVSDLGYETIDKPAPAEEN